MIHVFYIGSSLISRDTENRINKFERLDCSTQVHTIGVYAFESTENIASYSSKITNRVYSRRSNLHILKEYQTRLLFTTITLTVVLRAVSVKKKN